MGPGHPDGAIDRGTGGPVPRGDSALPQPGVGSPSLSDIDVRPAGIGTSGSSLETQSKRSMALTSLPLSGAVTLE
jgi:hypothetical protein